MWTDPKAFETKRSQKLEGTINKELFLRRKKHKSNRKWPEEWNSNFEIDFTRNVIHSYNINTNESLNSVKAFFNVRQMYKAQRFWFCRAIKYSRLILFGFNVWVLWSVTWFRKKGNWSWAIFFIHGKKRTPLPRKGWVGLGCNFIRQKNILRSSGMPFHNARYMSLMERHQNIVRLNRFSAKFFTQFAFICEKARLDSFSESSW